ncbi:hypothetical protein DFP73DRAFT_538826 [Morchella snyderi]|nr:hypothetical protein DFP73DRAFT_538826 [Morchella snyderi]
MFLTFFPPVIHLWVVSIHSIHSHIPFTHLTHSSKCTFPHLTSPPFKATLDTHGQGRGGANSSTPTHVSGACVRVVAMQGTAASTDSCLLEESLDGYIRINRVLAAPPPGWVDSGLHRHYYLFRKQTNKNHSLCLWRRHGLYSTTMPCHYTLSLG